MRIVTIGLMVGLALLFLFQSAGASDTDFVIAVLGIENAAIYPLEKAGNGIAGQLTGDLTATDKFQVVERVQVEKVIENLKLEESDLFEPLTASRVGQWLRADYVVLGVFTSYVPQPIKEARYDGHTLWYETVGYEIPASIDLRVIDVKTGMVVYSPPAIEWDIQELNDIEILVAASAAKIICHFTGEICVQPKPPPKADITPLLVMLTVVVVGGVVAFLLFITSLR